MNHVNNKAHRRTVDCTVLGCVHIAVDESSNSSAVVRITKWQEVKKKGKKTKARENEKFNFSDDQVEFYYSRASSPPCCNECRRVDLFQI